MKVTVELSDQEMAEILELTGERKKGPAIRTLPLLPTPANVWQQAIELGQACRRIGRTVLSLDLLVAAVALHHNAELVSFDADFDAIASVSALRLNRLTRPV
jgi:predicted nucleic acid-binding protein